MPDYAAARRNMVENQLRPNRIDDPRVIAAMLELPREAFVPNPLKGTAYGDEDLDLGGGQRLIEPLALGKLLQTASPRATDVALVIGCDTGYVAAVLARLTATVFLLLPGDRDTGPVDQRLNDLQCDNVIVQTGDPAQGLASQAPFDVIVLAGAVQEVPQGLLAQLGDGGRLVAVVQDGHAGRITLCRNVGGAIGRTTPFDAWVPLIPELRPQPTFVF